MSNLGERIKEINDRIDAEFSRRKYIGSLADKVSPLSEISPSDDFILPYVEKIKDLLLEVHDFMDDNSFAAINGTVDKLFDRAEEELSIL